MHETRFLLDANVFIAAARQYYGFDLVPSFWRSLEDHARTGRIGSIDRVKDELLRGKDDLAEWAQGAFAGWLVAYAKVYGLTVVTHETYAPDARKKVPIPNICRAFAVTYVDTWAMLRALGAKLG